MAFWKRLKLFTAAVGFLPLCAWADSNSNQVLNDSVAQTPSEWQYAWSARLFGLGVFNSQEQSDVAGLQLSGDVARKFNPYIDAEMGVKLRVSTGSSHALYAINRVDNGPFIDQALLNLNPIPEHFTITAGAINQRFLLNPLLLDENAFPGVTEKLAFDQRRYGVDLVAEQAIPSSTSLSVKTSEKEPLPSLFTESVYFLIAPVDSVVLHARAGLYTFNELPSQVANDGYINGNICDCDIPQAASFTYDFRGYTYGGDLSLQVHPKVLLMGGFDGLTNTEAPSEYGNGILAFASAALTVEGDWILTPRWEYFSNERQTSPAFYNSPDYGHNNFHGFAYSLRLQSAKNGLAIRANYTDARLIEDDPLQANTQIFMFYVELFDAHL